jgi:hypothetical protein
VSAGVALAAAGLLHDGMGRVADVMSNMQQELALEGLLHAPLGTPTYCLRQYGIDSDALPRAPLLAADTDAAGADAGAGAGAGAGADAAGEAGLSRMPSAAACLASPVEPAEQEGGHHAAARAALARLRAPAPAEAPASPTQIARAAAAFAEAARDDGDVCPLELWQRRAALLECAELVAEHARRSAPARRARRRALVRAVRGARDGARALVDALVPTNASP